jgi:nucleoid-associated protein YgaU
MPVTLYSRYYGLGPVTIDDQVSLTQRPSPPLVDYPDSLVHVIVGGETLDQLAFAYYGREDLWWRIADANPRRFPLDWIAGDKIIIPPLRVATRTAGR